MGRPGDRALQGMARADPGLGPSLPCAGSCWRGVWPSGEGGPEGAGPHGPRACGDSVSGAAKPLFAKGILSACTCTCVGGNPTYVLGRSLWLLSRTKGCKESRQVEEATVLSLATDGGSLDCTGEEGACFRGQASRPRCRTRG